MADWPDARRTFRDRAQSYDSESTWMRETRLIAPVVPPPREGTLLDVCSGTGAVADYAESAGWNVVASDLTEAMMNRQPRSRPLVVADAQKLPFPSRAVRVITCRQGLQYLDPGVALAEWRRVARNEIRLAHIVMPADEDAAFWREYFAIASPARRQVFARDEMVRLVENLLRRVPRVSVLEGRGTLMGASRHLPRQSQTAVFEMFKTAPLSIRRRYNIEMSGDGSDFSYTQLWEFLTIA